jgi:AcrR family transcriptional regulator
MTNAPPTIDGSPKAAAILDAALEVFCERTFEGARVPDIARLAGIATGTIYHYFESKEALVNAVYQRWKRELKHLLVDEAPVGLSAREEFRHWWRGLWQFALEHPRAATFLETHHRAPCLDATSLSISDALLDGAVAYARRAQRAGAVRKANPHALIAMVLGSFSGLLRAMDGGELTYSERVVNETEDCAWQMIRI